MFNKNFLIALGIGLVVVGVLLFGGLFSTRKAHVNLDGKILKVRTMPTDDKNSIVVVDFRLANDSNIPFVANEAFIYVTGPDGKEVEGVTVARRDMDRVFQYYKLLGPKYNEALIIKDRVKPGEKMDRMVAAAMPVPESDVTNRKALKLRLVDIDGPKYDFTETKQ
jgi:hypothetical protein